MSRRLAFLGLLVILSQLASGCYWHRCGWWRWHHYPSCNPCFTTPMSNGHGASCPSCYGPGERPGVMYGQPPYGSPSGVPIISGPMPLYPGPMIETVPPGTGMPNPMPPKGGN